MKTLLDRILDSLVLVVTWGLTGAVWFCAVAAWNSGGTTVGLFFSLIALGTTLICVLGTREVLS